MPQALVGLAFGPAFAATTAGALLSSAVGIGLSVGLQLIANELFGPKPQKPEDVQGLFRQSVGSRSRVYGRMAVGGNVAFLETKNGALYDLIVHCQGPITGYHETYLDNRYVELQSGYAGGVVTPPYEPAMQIIDTQFGEPGVSGWGRLNTDFPTIWSPDHKLEGLAASLLYTASVDQEKVAEVYPNRITQLKRVIDGHAIYDPRNGSTVWTDNAALILRDYLTHPDGMKLPASLIDDDRFSAAANVCHESFFSTAKDGGLINRYPISLRYEFQEEPRSVVNRIIAASDGRLYLTSEGKIGFDAGRWVEPTVTISDDEGHIISYEMTDGSGPFRESNEIIVKYTQVEVGYKEATSDPWRDEELISRLGEVRSNTLPAYEIQHHNHARRIAKIVQARSSPRWQGAVVCNLYGLNCWDQRWINLVIPDLEIDGTFEIIGSPVINLEDMTVTLQVQSFEAATYDFDAATEEGVAPAVPEQLEAEELPVPANVVTAAVLRAMSQVEFQDTSSITTVTQTGDTVSSSENVVTDQQTQQVSFYVATMSWDAPPRAGLQAQAEYQVGASGWLALSVATNGTTAETPPMARGATVSMRVRWTTIGSAGDWADGAPVNIPGL